MKDEMVTLFEYIGKRLDDISFDSDRNEHWLQEMRGDMAFIVRLLVVSVNGERPKFDPSDAERVRRLLEARDAA